MKMKRGLSALSREERRYIKYIQQRTEGYIKYLEREGQKHSSAKRLKLKECQRCGFCCMSIICVPKPDEMEAIAEYLGITSSELARRYMVIDFIDGHYLLRFAREGQEDIAGTYPNYKRWFDHGYCIFYDKENKTCKIYPVRPLEARDWNCWEVKSSDNYSDAANAWKNSDIEKFISGFDSSTD